MTNRPPLTPLGISVLALLSERPMHPYEMYQLLMSRKEDRIVKLRPGSLYHAVDRLVSQDMVREVGTDRDGNRPERTIYEIAASGRRALSDRIAEILKTPVREYPLITLALSEIHNLDAAEAMALLRNRIRELTDDLEELAALETLAEMTAIPRIFYAGHEYTRAVETAEIKWLRNFIEQVESGELPWLTEALEHHVNFNRKRVATLTSFARSEDHRGDR